ncbi:MAG TPA: prepilin-type N-terminal cleavage/methylation domain-containing protein [Verrucomicrobiae bacterium]|nr:prepilin-type N-terminal cleavage/methylation domain-containing protein [Verrucomicrobiae bacterium]
MVKKIPVFKQFKSGEKGFSLVEVIIALFILSIVVVATYNAYLSANKVNNVQASISDTQQNARASLNLLVDLFKVAGSLLPAGLRGIEAANTNPDTVTIRFTNQSGTHFLQNTIAPGNKDWLEIPLTDDITGWGAGDKFYFWKVPGGPGQWMTINTTNTNNGKGVYEISFVEPALTAGCVPGDAIVKLIEFKYYVDQTDSVNPVLVQRDGLGNTGQLSEGLRNLNFQYTLSNGTLVDAPTVNDTIKLVTIDLTAATTESDPDWKADGGHRLRRLTSSVYLLSN